MSNTVYASGQSTQNIYVEEKKEEPLESMALFDVLPNEIALHIFSLLTIRDLGRACQVSRKWCQLIIDFGLLPQTRILLTKSMIGRRALCIDQNSGMGCIIYSQGKKTSAQTSKLSPSALEIWDLKKEILIKNISHDETTLTSVAFAYPYLLTKTDEECIIRNISTGEWVSHIKSDRFCNWSHFSISSYGYTYIINYGSENATLMFCPIITRDKDSYKIDDNTPFYPVSLLHNAWLIYTTRPGVLKIRDVTAKDIAKVGEDLITPGAETEKAIARTENEIETMPLRINFMAASGMTLVTASKKHLLVWDLNTRCLTHILPPLRAKPVALDGDFLLARTAHSALLYHFKSGEIRKEEQWKRDRDCPYEFYNNKVYTLSKKGETGTLTVYDFSKKA